MTIAEVLLLDLDIETDRTRKIFAVVPEDKAAWKPHEKSMPLGQLAKHIAQLPHLGALFLTTESLESSGGPKPFLFVSKEDLFSSLEASTANVRSALTAADDNYLMQDWAFKIGEKILYAAPRAQLYRTMFLNHFVHHRAQLGVYLRLLDIPVPGLYGPSADNPWTPS
jgi:uncharacterized damage-inducible protein DinB